MVDGILNGYRALDLTNETGFLCGKILADLGVDVIKIERPGGDPSRNMPPYYHDISDPEKSLYWFAYNMNKRGITLDLETSEGLDSFTKLVEGADFIIESFPPGYMAKLGLDYSALSQINPRVIMTSITPFGQTGPYSEFKATDLAAQAQGLMLSQLGDSDRAPVRISVPQAHMNAGADALEGTMIAHHYRELTGVGQHVDVSMMESCIQGLHLVIPSWLSTKFEVKRMGRMGVRAPHTPYIWQCKDGYITFLIAASIYGARTNKGITEWMDSEQIAPQLMKEKDWMKWDLTKATQSELNTMVEALEKFFKTHTKAELEKGAIERNIMLQVVNDSADVSNNIQLKERDFWVNLKHDELNDTIKYPGAFAKFSRTPIKKWRRAPLIGEHNDEILKELHSNQKMPSTPDKKEPSGEKAAEYGDQALKDLKVTGFVTAGVGPILLRSLATHGATVVLIESVKRPDITRLSSNFKDNKPGLNRSLTYAFINSDKYNMTIDLKHPHANEITQKLIKWSDVIVDNFRPGVMDRLGLSYEKVSAINPGVIWVSSSQQGQTGPHCMVAGYGPQLAGHAGLITLAGWPDRTPVSVGEYPDEIAPRFGVTALLAALDYRRKTGQGQHIDLAQFEAAIQFLSPTILNYTANNRIEKRDGNKCPYAAPHGVYRCQGDDKWCAIAVFTDTEWEAFCKVIGNPPWTQEAKFSTLSGRKEHEDELNELIEKWTVEHPAEEVMMTMQQAGVEAGAVRTNKDITENCPQLDHRHFWWTLKHPEIEDVDHPGMCYLLSKTPYKIQRAAPCLGEHNHHVCSELLGLSDEEFFKLEQKGIFD
ncbi:CaiB/BaiF CoA transferase family protein [Thermodesulfobacteriota bacterium]